MKDKFKVSEFFDSSMQVIFCYESESILKAKSLMLLNDFSQIPVLNENNKIIGSVSWKSIGKMESLGVTSPSIIEYIENSAIINENDDFLKYMKLVAKKDYVLVKDQEERLKGIITTYDMTINFKNFIIPFLHLGIIEDCIRTLIQSNEIQIKKEVDCLTFGEYINLLNKEQNWKKITKLQLIDKQVFIDKLNSIRILRNNIAHYKRKGLSSDEIFSIVSFATMMQTICS
ncbi:CBS domain-containing protein [Myroides odoratimimus]|uniref:CBS domain-containing protein n=1 Tax=Myroides odoratimimus TaxID=76832 RepID=UPI002574D606|nr:CBS domain-containing protein [Myroides odoratimimus]MDM1397852.1 CBS domain-containing protein [Myroides odoratimimus]